MGLAPKVCLVDGCPREVTRGIRCDRHPEKRSPSSTLTSAPGWKKIRAEVLARDDNTCYLCGRYADTVDHVEPAAYSGDSSHRNLRAACSDCNRRKSDK